MERLTTLVSSRGILKSCRSHNLHPVSSAPQIDEDLLRHHREGGTIYVCTDALPHFAAHVLPHLDTAFVLVSGDSDVPVDAAALALPAIKALLDSSHLTHWYAQNLATQHPKISPMPIGLDYHTMWEKPGLWGLSAMSPMAQEHLLITTLAASPPLSARYLNAYCNWHFALHRGDRRECMERVDSSLCFFESSAVPRASSWQRQAECMFVLSPEGAGMDCHRTWEALLLGCIPIVRNNALQALYQDLPILVVEDWAQVNRDLMLNFVNQLTQAKFSFSPLFRAHWELRFHNRATDLLTPMTFAEFRQLLTRQTG